MSTPYLPRQPGPYLDPSGVLVWERDTEEVDTYDIDVTDLLRSGETITSTTLDETSGLTATVTYSGATVTISVTAGTGSAVLVIVTSIPRTLRQSVRFEQRGSPREDVYA